MKWQCYVIIFPHQLYKFHSRSIDQAKKLLCPEVCSRFTTIIRYIIQYLTVQKLLDQQTFENLRKLPKLWWSNYKSARIWCIFLYFLRIFFFRIHNLAGPTRNVTKSFWHFPHLPEPHKIYLHIYLCYIHNWKDVELKRNVIRVRGILKIREKHTSHLFEHM